jgi:hypothetical protein
MKVRVLMTFFIIRNVIQGRSVASLVPNSVMVSHLRSNHKSVKALGQLEKQLKELAAAKLI